jgi:hypothetical protein
LDLQCGLIADSWVVGIRAHNNIFPINVLRPGVLCAAASKALVDARVARRVPADLGGFVTVFLKCLLGNTGVGRGGCRVELLPAAMFTSNYVLDVGNVVLCFD